MIHEQVAALETAARIILARIERKGGISNHGHRKRGTGCEECAALYLLADACGYVLSDIDGKPEPAPDSVSVLPCVGDTVSIRGKVEEVDENGDLYVCFASIGSDHFRMWFKGEHATKAPPTGSGER